MQLLGITDAENTCDCCGKTDLKCTVAFRQSDGGIVYYGRICAQRWSGKSQKQLNKEFKSIKEQASYEADATLRSDACYLEYENILNRLNNEKVEFGLRMATLRPFSEALNARRKEIVAAIATKYFLKPIDVVTRW